VARRRGIFWPYIGTCSIQTQKGEQRQEKTQISLSKYFISKTLILANNLYAKKE
jgi:hypothetical protein